MFPIMHVLGIKQEVVEQYPWVPINIFHAFNEAKAIKMERMENPRIVPLAWYREAWEEQELILGKDPWEYGATEQNRKTMDAITGYCHDQGLIKRKIPFHELFLSTFQSRKRGDEFRFWRRSHRFFPQQLEQALRCHGQLRYRPWHPEGIVDRTGNDACSPPSSSPAAWGHRSELHDVPSR